MFQAAWITGNLLLETTQPAKYRSGGLKLDTHARHKEPKLTLSQTSSLSSRCDRATFRDCNLKRQAVKKRIFQRQGHQGLLSSTKGTHRMVSLLLASTHSLCVITLHCSPCHLVMFIFILPGQSHSPPNRCSVY